MANEVRKEQAQKTAEQGGGQGLMRSGSNAASALALVSPFSIMRRFMEDLDQLFDPFGAPQGSLASYGRGVTTPMWMPEVEVLERDGSLMIRADIPGTNADDIQVEVRDGELIISGERSQEFEDRQGDVYRSERRYGRFRRTIPLPKNLDPEEVTATFNGGVLEIAMPAPKRPQSRRVQVQEAKPEAQAQQKSEQKSEHKQPEQKSAAGRENSASS